MEQRRSLTVAEMEIKGSYLKGAVVSVGELDAQGERRGGEAVAA